MVTVKICGVRDPSGADAVASSGAELAGLLFVPGRRRAITPERAEALRPRLGPVEPVGVFLDAPLERVRAVARRLDLSVVQLHGEEPPEYAEQLSRGGLRVVRAVRSGPGLLDQLRPYQDCCQAFIVDGPAPGSGRPGPELPAGSLAALEGALGRPVWLAGGLDPDRVGPALIHAGASGVDVASGVERDGRQDPDRIRAFVAAAKTKRATT